MAKKKRRPNGRKPQREKSPSMVSKLTKVAKVALAAGTGVALFNNSKLGQSITHEVIPALYKTAKTYNESLLGTNRKAIDIYDAFQKSVGKRGSAFKETLKQVRKKNADNLKDIQTGRYKPKIGKERTLFGFMHNTEQVVHSRGVKNMDVDAIKTLEKKAIEEMTSKYGGKYTPEAIKKIVKSTVRKRNELNASELSTSFLEKTLKSDGILDDDALDMMEYTLKRVKDGSDTAKNINRKLSKELMGEIKDKRWELKKQDTRQNLFLNKLGRRFGIDNLEEKFLGSKAMTLGELLENEDILDMDSAQDLNKNIADLLEGKNITINSLNDLKKAVKEDESLKDLIVDRNLRVRTDKADKITSIYDNSEFSRVMEDFMNKFNATLPGKILTKGIDFKNFRDAPDIVFYNKGVKSMLSQFDEGAVGNELKEMKVSMRSGFLKHKFYAIDRDATTGELHLGDELGEGIPFKMDKGTIPRMIQNILGSDRREVLANKDKLSVMLDINQDGKPNILKRFYNMFTKFTDDDWGKNIINRKQESFISGRNILEELYLMEQQGYTRDQAIKRIHDDNQFLLEAFEKLMSQNAIEQDTVQKLINVISADDFTSGSDTARKKVVDLLNLTKNDDVSEILDFLTSGDYDYTIREGSLSSLMKDYMWDAPGTLKRTNIQSSTTVKIPMMDMEMAETNVMFIEGEARQAILKEVLTEGEVLEAAIAQANISDQQAKSISILSLWRRLEDASLGKHEFDVGSYKLGDVAGAYDTLLSELEGKPALQNAYSSVFNEMKKEYGFLHKGVDGNPNEKYYSEYGEYDFIPTSKISLSKGILENVNQFIKELNGGRDHLDQVSPVTMVAQYMVSRLSYGLDESGLGLSHKSLSSPLNSAKNFFLKRVAPVMAAYTAFDYLNDLSQDMTGVGITGAMANSIRNLDILGRGIAYNTGLGQALDWLKQTSVIGEYWTGSTDFQNVEERKDWYENGYSPVRKSRFWSFGSASEFRGGDITFFQPNYWKRAHSDYHDKWLYGGNKEKWKHSIIPTPTHPLSTIRYLMDPYWLEKKHIDDAPTPLTGKMFSEGTPWGAVLNPTVGQVIKPVRMLPENRKRLTGKGRDAKSIIKDINEKRKLRKDRKGDGAANRDLLVINGTDIRNATYVPYGNPTDNELIITNGKAKGVNYINRLSDVGEYQTLSYDPNVQAAPSGYGTAAPQGGEHVVSRFKSVNKINKGIDAINAEISKSNNGMSTAIIEHINDTIKQGSNYRGLKRGFAPVGTPAVYSSSPDSSNEGTYYYNNLVNEHNTNMANYYDQKFMASFINQGLGAQTGDYMRDIVYSSKQLSGIYGFLADVVTGGPETTYRWENAGSYQSFSSRFWDAGVGGLGGGVMEIARRFFPSSDKSRVDYNPLRNNVADWLPEYLQVGNPFSKLTKGEMRLPGKGYESLNELHPDEFATDGYGAFDRFKILADVAPNSKEYKVWHNIVKHQTLQTNPGLKKEFEEIESRTKRMRGSHEFYEYQYLHTNTKYETGVVKEIKDNGQIVLGNNKVLNLAGINLNQNYQGELGDLLTPGKKITYRIEQNARHDDTRQVVNNAAVYVDGGATVNKQLMDMGVADRDKSDTSAIGQLATVSSTQELLGSAQELIAHARIPFVHNKLMHIETALESFKSEQMYGANFQTWDHPIESFIKPMMNEAMGQSMLRRGAAYAYSKIHFNTVLKSGNIGGFKKFASGAVMATLDPAAFLFGGVNFAVGLNNGRVGKGDQALGKFSRGAKFGSKVGTIAWGIANADNPLEAGLSFAAIGADLFADLEIGQLALERFGREINIKQFAVASAVIGLGISAIKNPDFNWDRMTQKWQPKKYQKMNEINEYFDRLEYIKYKGLYETASRKAALLEGTPIKSIFKDLDRNKARIAKLKAKQDKLLEKHGEQSRKYKAKNAEIQAEIDALTQSGNQMFTGGKWTKAAVAYKKAMESTIYGLQPGATKDEILAAVPDQYKDYFQAFMDEKDEGERKKILKHLPDYLKRPLQAAWGEEMEDVGRSNTRYFRSKKLPGINWRGWKPNVNLKHVKMKTIENEGMLLSDFGYYESEKAKPQYMMAPEIDDWEHGTRLSISTYSRLAGEMTGMGVSLSNVSLEKTMSPGLWLTADIKQSISDRYELTTNSMTNMIQGIVANFI